MDILLEEFSENDYKSVSVSRIVKRAEIAKGSFYQYFEDKKACYLYLIQLGMDERMAFMNQAPPPEQELDTFEYLRWLMNAGTQFEFSSPQLARIGYRAVFDDVPLPEETLKVIRGGTKDFFFQQVQQGIQQGYIKADIDPNIAAFIFNAVFTNLGQYLMERFEIQPDDLLQKGGQAFNQNTAQKAMNQVINILEHGLRKRE